MNGLKYILLFLLLSFSVSGMAQEKYTDQLKKQGPGGAVVMVHHDAELEELVNGSGPSESKDSVRTTLHDVTKPEKTSGPHTKSQGYRIQIYMAGNTAQDKNKVKSIARRFKSFFPAVNAYVYFNAPHWVCSVGDYRSKEEANAMLSQIRSTYQFSSASIVRSKINSFY